MPPHAVRRYQLVDEPAEDTYERIAFVAAALFDTPIATVSLVEQHRRGSAVAGGLAAGGRPG